MYKNYTLCLNPIHFLNFLKVGMANDTTLLVLSQTGFYQLLTKNINTLNNKNYEQRK